VTSESPRLTLISRRFNHDCHLCLRTLVNHVSGLNKLNSRGQRPPIATPRPPHTEGVKLNSRGHRPRITNVNTPRPQRGRTSIRPLHGRIINLFRDPWVAPTAIESVPCGGRVWWGDVPVALPPAIESVPWQGQQRHRSVVHIAGDSRRTSSARHHRLRRVPEIRPQPEHRRR
jgi:hypothetical protein